jgi:cystathionine beta-lyase/cystathionine gamma-synthase
MENALKVATWLESNPKVERVVYPRKILNKSC